MIVLLRSLRIMEWIETRMAPMIDDRLPVCKRPSASNVDVAGTPGLRSTSAKISIGF